MAPPPTVGELNLPDRTLLGPGPSDVHPRGLRAMVTPVVGYLDPSYGRVMDGLQALRRYVFRTDNEHPLAVTGSGSAAMETAFANPVEPGETVLVPDNGYFGARLGQMAARPGTALAFVTAFGATLADEGADVDPGVAAVADALSGDA